MKPHVLVIRLDSAGDVLLMGPAIRAVAHGATRVTLLCGPRGRAAAELLPGVDNIVEFEAPWIDPEPKPLQQSDIYDLVERIGALQVKQAVIFGSFHQSPLPMALILRLAGVPVVAASSEDYAGSLLDVRHDARQDLHEVQRALSLVETLGYSLPRGQSHRLQVMTTASAPVGLPERYLVVHPGTSAPARAWPVDHFRRLVGMLGDDGISTVVTGSADEYELTAAVASGHRDAIDLGGETDFGELAALIGNADLLVSGNTGPAHLAAAVGTPLVSVFAPTVSVANWRPWMVRHELLRLAVPCAGCRARVCPWPDHPCMQRLTPERVRRAVTELLGKEKPVRREPVQIGR